MQIDREWEGRGERKKKEREIEGRRETYKKRL